ncbi:MAG: 3-isopropylmalate dehydratase small subunit, partial [Chloroflexi bacterium]|nr:3-isopropylmalate dehydratase small subunit [Chloroflexota bacterium]
HAVWAIQQMGVGAVISNNFADIFRNNSAKMGLLTVVLAREDVEHLMARAEELPSAELTVDLESQTVSTPEGWSRRFEVDPFVKRSLLEGLDDISLTMEHTDAIDEFESGRAEYLPDTGE